MEVHLQKIIWSLKVVEKSEKSPKFTVLQRGRGKAKGLWLVSLNCPSLATRHSPAADWL